MSIPPHARPLYQYAKLVGEKGTPQERLDLANDIRAMRELREAFPGSSWEPMEHVKLIEYVVGLAQQIASRRHQNALRRQFKDYQGKMGRTYEEELQVVMGELACQICLALPLGKPTTEQEARVFGNIGRGHVAYIPFRNPYSHNLIVNPKYPDHFCVWLVVPEEAATYRLTGWITATRAKEVGERKKDWPRPGSDAIWVHPSTLGSVKSWWDQWSG